MKALTIRNPWATLIVEGYKEYEFRSWKTNYRGKILIHAGLGIDKELLEKFKDYDLDYIGGAIIGEADLVDCILVDEHLNNKLKKSNPRVYSKSKYTENYAWKLDNIKKYDKPIFIKGQLGLWNYEKEI